MSSNTETVAKLFEYAISLERGAETLYRELERMFASYPEIASFWKHYADEEKGHASYLERVRVNVDANRLSAKADDDILRKVHRCLAEASAARLVNIKTLEDAYQLAVELENSETNAVFEFVILNFSTDELAKSRSFLHTQLSAHITRLETDFPASYRSAAARQSVFALQ